MTKNKGLEPNLTDFVFAGILIIAITLLVWNTIQIQQIKKLAKYNKEHICFITDILFGPMQNVEELCDVLRDDLHEEWNIRSNKQSDN